MRKLAELWIPNDIADEKTVKCLVCAHYCQIPPEKLGFCKTRKNIGGQLYTLIYGSMISRGSIDPIEKKPLHHFYPNSSAFSIASVGCNLRCKHCQNWHLSKSFPNDDGSKALFTHQDQNEFAQKSFNLYNSTPEQVVQDVLKHKCDIIAYTYNEPLIWYEFVKDTALLAKQHNIKNVLVTGGYSSKETNEQYINFIDAANIDIKGFSSSFYEKIVGISNFQPILDTSEYFYNHGVHVELTYLLIPNENDNPDEIRAMCHWIAEKLDKDVALHFSAYHPDYRLNQPYTSISQLVDAYNIAKSEGLRFIYLGNVRNPEYSDTICPSCGKSVIARNGYMIKNIGLTPENKCKFCNSNLPIQGKFVERDD